jgi:hypothetical protein
LIAFQSVIAESAAKRGMVPVVAFASRRDALRVFVGCVAFSLTRTYVSVAAPSPLVPLGEDRFSQRFDATTNTQTIEGLDFVLNQTLTPAGKHLIVRGDHVTLDGAISLPGNDVTIIARTLNCASGASISTKGRVGNPDYTGDTALPGKNGAGIDNDGQKPGGPGGNGGKITIVVGQLIGNLQLDVSGGPGGAAQNGGIGLDGSPGTPANRQHSGGQGTPGQCWWIGWAPWGRRRRG